MSDNRMLIDWKGWVEAAVDCLYEGGKDTEAEAVELMAKALDSHTMDFLSWYNKHEAK